MPRFKKVALFPYSFNEYSELVLLFIMDTRGSAKEVLYDFGCKLNKNEPTVYYSAVRSFQTLTKGIFNKNSFEGANEKITFTEESWYGSYQQGLNELLYNHKNEFIQSIEGEWLWLFFPLETYIKRDKLNEEISNIPDMEHLEFNWVPIDSFQDFSTKQLVSSFNKEIIAKNKIKLLELQKDQVDEMLGNKPKAVISQTMKLIPQDEDIMESDNNSEDANNNENHATIDPEAAASTFEIQNGYKYPDFGILVTEPREVWRYQYPALFTPNLVDEGETWKFYHCFEDEYPTKKELSKLKGLIIPGNADSPLDDKPYIHDTIELVKDIYENHHNVKLVGVWFGHQLITIALGGHVSKLDIDVPIVLGKHKMKIATKELYKMEEFKYAFGEDFKEDHIYFNRAHGFYVTQMPEDAECLFKSDYGEYDVYRIFDRVLSIQPHPDFPDVFLDNHIVKRLRTNGIISEEYMEKIQDNLYNRGIRNYCDEMMSFIRYFLKSEAYKESDDKEDSKDDQE